MATRRGMQRAMLGLCVALVLFLSGWATLRGQLARAATPAGPPADASCAALARVDWTATNGPQWGRTLLPGHNAPGGWFGVDVCGNGINAYGPGGANLSCDRAPANFASTGCAPGWATYDGFGLSFQCVELVVRFSAWAFGDRASAWLGNAPDLWLRGNHPADFSALPNGSSQPPVPGDVVVWGAVDAHGRPWPAGANNAHDGHVAVVAAVKGSKVQIVEENTLWGSTNVPSEMLPLAHTSTGWVLGKSTNLYGWLHSAKHTGHFDGHGAVHGTPTTSPGNRSASSTTGLPSLAQGVVVTTAGSLADLTWDPSGTAPQAAARSLGAPPGVRLAPSQTPVALVAPTGGRDIYALGRDGEIYVAQTAPTHLGVAWQALGAPPGIRLVGSVAASPLPNGIALGAIGSDGGLWWRAGPVGNLGGWTTLGHPPQATLVGAPILAGAPGTGLPLALARGQDGRLYESDWASATPDSGAQAGWSAWQPVALPPQAGPSVSALVPISEQPSPHAHIGAWTDAPLDVVALDVKGALWILRRTGAKATWQPYAITGASGIQAVLGGVALPPLASSTSHVTTLLHIYASSMRGTQLVSVGLDAAGTLQTPTWTQVAPPLAIQALAAAQGSAIALGPDSSILMSPSGQRVELAGKTAALALVAATAPAPTPATPAPASAPAWVSAGIVPGPETFADAFLAPAIDPRWSVVGAASAARIGSGGTLSLAPETAPDRTMLLQGGPAGDTQVTAKIALPATVAPTTRAGLVLYLDAQNWLTLGVSRSGGASFCPAAWGQDFPCQTGALPRAADLGKGLYLRFERYGSIFSGFVSADGSSWTMVGSWRPAAPSAAALGTPSPSPVPTHTAVGATPTQAPAPATSQDMAALAFTSVGLYAQAPADSAPASGAASWPSFLSFDVATPGAANTSLH